MEKLIEVKATVEQVFSLFSDPVNVPRWWAQSDEVRVIDVRQFHWLMNKADGPRSWSVSVQALEPPVHLLWRAAPNAGDRQNENAFTLEAYFEATVRQSTIVRLIYSEIFAEELSSPGDAFAVAEGSPAVTTREFERVLEDFKKFVEQFDGQYDEQLTRETARAAAPPLTEIPLRKRPTGEAQDRIKTSARPLTRRKLPFLWLALSGLAVSIALAAAVLLVWTARRQQPSDRAAPPAANATTAAEAEVGSAISSDPIPARSGGAQSTDESAKAEKEIAPTEGDEDQELRRALSGWVAATNARDIGALMSFYAPVARRYYLRENFSIDQIRADKMRLDELATLVDVSAHDPDITFSSDGQTAQMIFRKDYNVEGSKIKQRGQVVEELRWRRTGGGWKIISERDLRVIR